MQNNSVYLESQGEIATLVLNRPNKLNALNAEVLESIKAYTAEVAQNADIKVMILRGATAQVFSSGRISASSPRSTLHQHHVNSLITSFAQLWMALRLWRNRSSP